MQKVFWLSVLVSILAACQPAAQQQQPATQAAATDNAPMQLKLPVGIDAPPPVPADNPITPAKVELGRELFFDARLSADDSVSCATCHNPVMGYTDGRPTSMGVKGQIGGRSAPTFINLAYATNGVFGTAARNHWKIRRRAPSRILSKWAALTKSSSPA